MYENGVLRMIFGTKRKMQESGDDCILRRSVTCMVHHILLE